MEDKLKEITEDKMTEKKYRLLKDLPGCKTGEIFVPIAEKTYHEERIYTKESWCNDINPTRDNCLCKFTESEINNVAWFEPIVEEKSAEEELIEILSHYDLTKKEIKIILHRLCVRGYQITKTESVKEYKIDTKPLENFNTGKINAEQFIEEINKMCPKTEPKPKVKDGIEELARELHCIYYQSYSSYTDYEFCKEHFIPLANFVDKDFIPKSEVQSIKEDIDRAIKDMSKRTVNHYFVKLGEISAWLGKLTGGSHD